MGSRSVSVILAVAFTVFELHITESAIQVPLVAITRTSPLVIAPQTVAVIAVSSTTDLAFKFALFFPFLSTPFFVFSAQLLFDFASATVFVALPESQLA